MDEKVHERAAFEHDLWVAVRDDLDGAVFQPLANLSDGEVRGYEILARWTARRARSVAPDLFIPAAEGAALIGDLATLNLMRRACREAAGWAGQPVLSINLSPVLLQDRDIDRKILKVLVETGFQPGRLEIELTETALVSDYDAARAIFVSLKEQGVRIALDNFGEGHSSLRQLRELPFDASSSLTARSSARWIRTAMRPQWCARWWRWPRTSISKSWPRASRRRIR